MQSVESSNLAAVGYNSDNQILNIRFNSGSLYEYSGVPRPIYDGLMSAPSKGRYFNQNIKKAGYPYTQIG